VHAAMWVVRVPDRPVADPAGRFQILCLTSLIVMFGAFCWCRAVWQRCVSLAVSSADVGSVVNLERMAVAVASDGMTLSGPRRRSCLAVLRHPPRIFVMHLVKWLVRLGGPAMGSVMARTSFR
jgi:hypothetical protein